MLLYLGTENEGHVFSLDHLECKKQRETFLFFLNGSSFILVLGLMCLRNATTFNLNNPTGRVEDCKEKADEKQEKGGDHRDQDILISGILRRATPRHGRSIARGEHECLRTAGTRGEGVVKAGCES